MLDSIDGEEILRQFPSVEFAFAYGSGVLPQAGYNYSNSSLLPMLDLVFAVSDPVQWHRLNMQLHPSHYTSIVPLTPNLTAYVQNNFGAGMWYNVDIPLNIRRFPHRKMKYGVISTSKLSEDLLNWTDLYIAGRLHKPVFIIKSNPLFDNYVEINREHALRAAVFLLPPKFGELELFLSIASLSYNGDPRMGMSENPMKVRCLASKTNIFNLVTSGSKSCCPCSASIP